MHGPVILIFVLATILSATSASSQAGVTAQPSTPTPTTAQIIEQLQRHDQRQTSMLQSYEGLRHYSVIYRGFARTITASMDVEMNYDAASGKSFRIISQKGSSMLCEKVLKRALDSEKEASVDKSSTALNSANYKFQLVGTDQVGDRAAYVLTVEPISPSKFLYKGKIWVDAAEFAVAKMEVQPAKNPSFWISRTMIHHTNQMTNDFWLPDQNRSETKVRIGGTATMSIDYQSYRITSQPEFSTTPPAAGTH
jgi:outer membrane lipoprotein-sorting protein